MRVLSETNFITTVCAYVSGTVSIHLVNMSAGISICVAIDILLTFSFIFGT